MQRRVVKQGPSTFMVSLPKEWVKRNNIQKGQILEVLPEEKTITISPSAITPTHRRLDLTILDPTCADCIIWKAYSLGVHELNVKCASEEVMEKLRNIVSSLVGADIRDRTGMTVRIVVLDSTEEINIQSELSKALYLIKEMITILMKEVEQGGLSEASKNPVYYDVVKKLNYILRYIYVKKYALDTYTSIYQVAKSLLLIPSHIMYVSRVDVFQTEITHKEEILSQLKQFSEYLDRSVKVVNKKPDPKDLEIHHFREDMEVKITDLMQMQAKGVLPPHFLTLIYVMVNRIDNFIEYLGLMKMFGEHDKQLLEE